MRPITGTSLRWEPHNGVAERIRAKTTRRHERSFVVSPGGDIPALARMRTPSRMSRAQSPEILSDAPVGVGVSRYGRIGMERSAARDAAVATKAEKVIAQAVSPGLDFTR